VERKDFEGEERRDSREERSDSRKERRDSREERRDSRIEGQWENLGHIMRRVRGVERQRDVVVVILSCMR
jgi:hypothetical protein